MTAPRGLGGPGGAGLVGAVSPDPTAIEIATLTGRPYNDARVALRLLESPGGWTTEAAREFLVKEWTLGASLEQMARAAIDLAASLHFEEPDRG